MILDRSNGCRLFSFGKNKFNTHTKKNKKNKKKSWFSHAIIIQYSGRETYSTDAREHLCEKTAKWYETPTLQTKQLFILGGCSSGRDRKSF